MMRGMTVTDLAFRAMSVMVHELGIAQYQPVYVEGVSEEKRLYAGLLGWIGRVCLFCGKF